MITRNHRQEALCRAYVHAVGALEGAGLCNYYPDYGIDLSLRLVNEYGTRHEDGGCQIDFQLRSTTRAALAAEHVRYDLDVRTYDFLRRPTDIARLLVLLVLPDEESNWLTFSAEELVIRHAAYWFSLRNAPPISASSSIRVHIPRHQLFSVLAAQQMMTRLRSGELPC